MIPSKQTGSLMETAAGPHILYTEYYSFRETGLQLSHHAYFHPFFSIHLSDIVTDPRFSRSRLLIALTDCGSWIITAYFQLA